jgi:putative transposase
VPYWPTKEERKVQKAQRRAAREAKKAQRAAELTAIQEQSRAASQPIPTRLPPKPKSHRQQAAEKQMAQVHRKVSNRRSNFLHEVTTRLVRHARKRGTTLAIEGLRIKTMMAGGLGRQISDLGWGEFRRQLEYKCDWYGVALYIAPTFYPSSKTCSRCGQLKADLARSERVYHCDRCGLIIDRDLNAARNLRNQAVMAIARGETSRPGSSGQVSSSRKRAPARKATSALVGEQIISAPAQ